MQIDEYILYFRSTSSGNFERQGMLETNREDLGSHQQIKQVSTKREAMRATWVFSFVSATD